MRIAARGCSACPAATRVSVCPTSRRWPAPRRSWPRRTAAPRTFSASFHYRAGGRWSSFRRALAELRVSRPAIIYVLDLGLSGIAAALAYRRVKRCRIVLDTGDAVAELLWSTGRVGRAGKTLLQ